MSYGPKRGMKKPRGRKAKQAIRIAAQARSRWAAERSRVGVLRWQGARPLPEEESAGTLRMSSLERTGS